MKIYEGRRTPSGVEVLINGIPLDPRPSLEFVKHSPDGFNWGYGGSGPAQLAFAILHDFKGEHIAFENYQEFKWEIIGGLKDWWQITEDAIEAFLVRNNEDRFKEESEVAS